MKPIKRMYFFFKVVADKKVNVMFIRLETLVLHSLKNKDFPR